MSSAPGFHRPSRTALLALVVLVFAAACEPEPTPLPVLPIAASPAPEETAPATGLDVVTVDALTLRLLPAEAHARLDEAAPVQEVDSLGETPAGPALSVLPFTGGLPTGYGLNIVAQPNTALPPLNDPQLASALAEFLTSHSANSLRLALANAGYPDGVAFAVDADPALWPLLLVGISGGPVAWFPVAGGAPAQVTLAVGAEADALLNSGGILLGVLPLYAQGWSVGRGDDGLPLFAPVPPG